MLETLVYFQLISGSIGTAIFIWGNYYADSSMGD